MVARVRAPGDDPTGFLERTLELAGLWQKAPAVAERLWVPNPGPQLEAFESLADVTGYGGAPGGGKSWLLLGLAFTRHRRSLILRREQTRIRDLWDSAMTIADGRGRSNDNLHLLRNLPGARSIELGGLQREDDWRKYQGRAYDLHGFDELTEFTESQFRTLIAWNRTTIPGQRCRIVAAFNPPLTPDGEWVLQYFAPWLDAGHPNPAEPGELRWYVMLEGEETEWPDGEPFERDGELLYPRSRTFIPARVQDNPQLLATGYVATLQSLPEPMRSQLLFGSFTAGLQTDPWQVIPNEWIYAAEDRYRALEQSTHPLRFICLGADIGAGGDRTVLADRVLVERDEEHPEPPPAKQAIIKLSRYTHADTMKTAGLIAQELREFNGSAVIDVIGIGAGVYDRLREEQYRAIPFNAGQHTDARDASGRLGFTNQRSYAWWLMRELLDPANDEQIALPPDSLLRSDLMAPHWRPTSSGRIEVESKEDIRRRLHRSTDDGDAVVMAFSLVESHGSARGLPRPSRWKPARPSGALFEEEEPNGQNGHNGHNGHGLTATIPSRWRR